MKKCMIIFVSLMVLTACDNEPLDDSIIIENPTIPGPGDGNGSESDDLTLVLYELDTDISFSFFGIPIQSITNSDLTIADDVIVSGINALSIDGTNFVTENQVITRNEMGQVISDVSINAAGVVTNEYLVTYENNVISTITYDYFEGDEDDFSYNFTFEGNTITRAEEGSNITTVFTLDTSGRVIQKESFDGEFSIQNEVVTYSSNGNITNSISTGELEQNSVYTYDTNLNPLKVVYSDNYLLNFLGDDYSDEIGQPIAQFHSTNNWTGATFNNDSFTFNISYNSVGRIETRDISFSLGEEFSTEINERFTYAN